MKSADLFKRTSCHSRCNWRQKQRESKRIKPTQGNPSLWWFPYPLIAGTVGPIASAFSICALSVPWRVVTPTNGTEELIHYVDDPKWLTSVNAAQLAIALISNLFLFLNMAGRVKLPIAQAVVITGWYISSTLLVALTVAVSVPVTLALPYEYSFTQAYYYAAFSAVLYFLVATMMAVTVFGFYKGHYNEEFKLTVRRKSLMIQTSGFLLYLLSGAAVYAHIEDWEYLDAVYWADYTILTVGIGDFTPKTRTGRSLLFPFAIGGIIIFGLVVYTIRSLVVDRGKLKMGAAMVEKLRQKVLMNQQKDTRGEILNRFGSELDRNTQIAGFRGSKEEFNLMRQIQDQALSKRRWISLLVSASSWFVLWFVSASIFKATEKTQSWSYLDSLYFTYTSLLTIGYGDLYPVSSAGKAYFVLWSLLAVPSLTILVSNLGDTVVKKITNLLLWAGDLFVFPTEGGLKSLFERVTHRMTKEERSAQEMHSSISNNLNDQTENFRYHNQEPSLGATLGSSAAGDREREESKLELPLRSKKDLHCLLIKEIGATIQHAKSSPPKKYTFDEWLWYLELLSQHKSNFGSCFKTPGILEADGGSSAAVMAARGSSNGQDELGPDWSWIGDHSPLMVDIGEPEWLLERLLEMLERELKIVKTEERGLEDHL